ncbi:MAG: leucyl aminopeptidase [Candidatus Obscuribacterales bacterium]|nr:leucyl aminopeptidase [Candidatus Obscuribacterales bacterium]
MAIQFSVKSSSNLAKMLARHPERANLILGVFSGEKFTGFCQDADELTNGTISRRVELGGFEPKLKKTLVVDSDLSVDGLDRVILVGLGARSRLTLSGLRRAITAAFEAARDVCSSEHLIFPLIDVDLRGLTIEQFAEVVTQYACLMDYEMNHQKSREPDDAPSHLKSVILLAPDWALPAVRRGIRRGQLLGDATNRARDMVNEPSETMNPERLAEIAREIAANSNGLITCKVMGLKEITKLGMGGVLAVNAGSVDDPVFIDMTYTPPSGPTEVIGLVGKGITFDSGGLGIKDGEGMKDMKMDMAGAAAVLSVMSALPTLKPKVSVRAVVAATDNLVAARAFRPGMVVKTMSGLTVEIDHTDAEGRMTLCDALHYIQEKGGATKVIDLATLTGAVEDALGNVVTGVFGNDSKFTRNFLQCAAHAGEEMWEMPLTESYRENNKGRMADLTNDGSGPGHTAAAWFLCEFIKEGVSWCHLDIAATAFRNESIGVDPAGGTGVGVRSLLEFLAQYA